MEVFYRFTPNKSYAYLLNVQIINLFKKKKKTYQNKSHGQNGRPLEIENKVNLILLIDK